MVCVEAKPIPFQSLVEGKSYVVRGIFDCTHGHVLINVGAKSLLPNPSGFTALPCGCRIHGKWHGANRFRPLDSLTEQLERIESEGCPVELEPEYA